MATPGKRKQKNPYDQEIQWARAILKPFGLVVLEGDLEKYEIAKARGRNVSLVIYPHKTSAGNYHARVRDNGSKNKTLAQLLMRALDHGYGLSKAETERIRLSCTFQQNNYSTIWDSKADIFAALEQVKALP